VTRFILVRKALRDVRGATIGIGLTAFVIALVDMLVFPAYKETLKNFDLGSVMKGFLGEAGSFATLEGYLTGEFFSWVPLLMIIGAIIGGTAALAGEESDGTMDLLLAQPVTRTRLVLEKAAGLLLAVTAMALVSLPGFALGAVFGSLTDHLGQVWPAVVNMLPVTFLFLTLSLWASAALPTRGAAAAAATGAAVLTYFLNLLGASVSWLDMPRKLSPFYWSDASRILLHGFDWLRAGALLALAALFLALAVWSFERRDLAPGAREWSVRSLLAARLPHRRPTGEPRRVAKPI